MPGANLFTALDAQLGGRLCEYLEEWKAEGLTLTQTQERIAEECGWAPGRSTLGRWLAGECQ